MVVTVTVNADDELEAHYAWSIAPAAPSAATKDEPVEFTNTYEVGRLIIKKTVSGNRGSRTFAFPFTVEFWDAQGKEIKDTFKFTGSRTGLIKSGQTVRLRHGEYIVIEGIPAGTTYRVTETNSAYHRPAKSARFSRVRQ